MKDANSTPTAPAQLQLHVYGKVPLFYLPATSGGQSGPAATRSRYNLVLVFLEGGPEGEVYLQILATLYPAILADDARAIAVVQAPLEEAERMVSTLDLPFALLADDGAATTRRVLGEGNHAALCIADRWGIIYFVEAATDTASLPPASVIPEWLQFIEIQCPECTDGSDQIWLSADNG